ncbi:MAG: urease accessory protein UreD, partial [Cyanobacteria bacterium]|nr:urease accessory protein UreD [Cyanobacteriota bacterium]
SFGSGSASSVSGSPAAPHLSMRVSRAGHPHGPSFIAHQYATYPFRLSGNLALDPTDPKRVYAYIMNACPGILAGDDLHLNLQLGAGASLYLTDQSATKVHSRPSGGADAQMTWTVQVGAEAYLEYIPEPVILFAASSLTQRMQVTLHPQGRLVLSEIIVPGRLARGECYDFDQFQSRLRVQTPEGALCFADNLRLWGQPHPFQNSAFLTDLPIMGNFIVVVPGVSIADLTQMIQSYGLSVDDLRVGHSPLPGCQGVLVRAISTHVSLLKHYQHHLLNGVRQLTGNAPLPDIPK